MLKILKLLIIIKISTKLIILYIATHSFSSFFSSFHFSWNLLVIVKSRQRKKEKNLLTDSPRRQWEGEYQLHGYLPLEFSGNSRSKSSPGTLGLRWANNAGRPRELSHLHMNWRSPCRSVTRGLQPSPLSPPVGQRRWTHTTRLAARLAGSFELPWGRWWLNTHSTLNNICSNVA